MSVACIYMSNRTQQALINLIEQYHQQTTSIMYGWTVTTL